ncbi:MAG TPA: DUF3667 domain-containing protein [Niabella sp.]|nr:DUF3667 domain-containing protein [Niabella sp.]
MNKKEYRNELERSIQKRLGSSGLKRIDYSYVKHEILHLFHLEKGFLYTIKELIVRPGKTMQSYLFENRKKYVKPVTFVILTSLIYTIALHYFQKHPQISTTNHSSDPILTIMSWMDKNWGYANLLIGIFMGLWLKIFLGINHTITQKLLL